MPRKRFTLAEAKFIKQLILQKEKELLECVCRSETDNVRALLKNYRVIPLFKIDATDRFGVPSLWYAVLNNNLEMVKLLLEYGANPLVLAKKSINPWSLLARQGSTMILEVIKDNCKNLSEKSDEKIKQKYCEVLTEIDEVIASLRQQDRVVSEKSLNVTSICTDMFKLSKPNPSLTIVAELSSGQKPGSSVDESIARPT